MIDHLWLWSTRLAYFKQHYLLFWVFYIFTHFEMAFQAWFGTPIHPKWTSPMLMNENEIWDFTHAPQSCKGFMKVLINWYWDKLWILLVSHGPLAFVGLNKTNLHNLSHPPTLPLLLLHLHLGQLCWCEGGGGHPWHFCDHGFMGNGKEVFFTLSQLLEGLKCESKLKTMED
jgi:hypothetical protein